MLNKSILVVCAIAVIYVAVSGAASDPVCCGQFSLKNCTRDCEALTCYGIHHTVPCNDPCQDMCVCSPYLYLDRCSGTCVYHTNCPSIEQTEQCQDTPVDYCPTASA